LLFVALLNFLNLSLVNKRAFMIDECILATQ
jgi:hypothetical protein